MTEDQVKNLYHRWLIRQGAYLTIPHDIPEYLMPFILELTRDKK